MSVTPAILLAKLQGLSIDTEVISHPAVLTVEVRSYSVSLSNCQYGLSQRVSNAAVQEANKYTGDDPGVDVKNLFLKVFLPTFDTCTSPLVFDNLR